MKDVKTIVAQNLTALRKERGLTQLELAERFNYSDKAICRWEHADTLPDINVLYALCEFYGITMNQLVDPHFSAKATVTEERNARAYRNWACAMLVSAVFFFATVLFIFSLAWFERAYWLAFVWAVPISCIVISKILRRGMGAIGRFIFTSLLIWSTIAAVYLQVLVRFDSNIWYLFLVGLPLQAFVFLWSRLKRYRGDLY